MDARHRRELFGRPLSRYFANIPHIPRYLRYVVRCFSLFENPMEVMRGYLTGTPPAAGCIRLRDGMTIRLSSDKLDVVTVFLIFVREDYGHIPPGSSVIDVGANIGVFSLFAAHEGARVIHAYEPNGHSFACLVENIRENKLDARVYPHHMAMSGGEKWVRFPITPSVHNAIIKDATADTVNSELIPSLTLVSRWHR